jgi:hypothetical protein
LQTRLGLTHRLRGFGKLKSFRLSILPNHTLQDRLRHTTQTEVAFDRFFLWQHLRDLGSL